MFNNIFLKHKFIISVFPHNSYILNPIWEDGDFFVNLQSMATALSPVTKVYERSSVLIKYESSEIRRDLGRYARESAQRQKYSREYQ